MGVDELAEELYTLPPGDFIAARDRAAAAAPRGERGAIRALRRPSLAAWAVNLLVREDPSRSELLLRLGAELRAAHGQPSGAGRLRELIGQQRQLVAALARRAGQLTADAGRPVSDAVLREVEGTVHAALADPEAARELAGGRLTKALPPPSGFGVLPEATVHQLRPLRPPSGADGSGAAPAGTAGGERRASVTDITERARAQERADRERRLRLREARGEAEELARAARGSAEEATAAERELSAARRRLREAREQVHGLTEELRRAKRSLSAAERAERAARGPAQRARQAAERDRKRAEAARAEADRLAPEAVRRPGRRGRRRPGASS
ncbi:hypothetical protein KBZ10_23605 [Streptomyces sp. F63]|uniref:hypothetical protein n=1 Tax=Streptomyces sp. F63 TaxID=2824887 RepID=UPI001B368628|nr:hypothetical protein [Streptomyces sp. F63]MBQ0987451.1 hypothetical protein [Streptomyces sp. F63]